MFPALSICTPTSPAVWLGQLEGTACMLISIITDRAPFSLTYEHTCISPVLLSLWHQLFFLVSINNWRIGYKSAGVCVRDSISWLFVWKENKPSGFIRISVNNPMDPQMIKQPSYYIYRVAAGLGAVF